jgi:NAD(P)-dependent dehydrogenase (short-subunit alcohol dehydrogenase family)
MSSLSTTQFTAASTAADVVAGLDLTGRRVVVTGGSSGIGYETALALAGAGAEVTLAVRDLEAGLRAAREILAATGRPVDVARLDLADGPSIDSFVEQWSGPLHVLVANAGIMALPELTRTPEGWETQLAVNHLGHAQLVLGLHGSLAAAGSSRVVLVSSAAHQMAAVDLDDLHFERRAYEPWSAYAQSKTAIVQFAVAAARRWAGDGITVNAVHPGGIMTNLQRHLDEAALAFVGAKDEEGNTLELPPGWKTPQQGAATQVLVAASPLVAGVTGRYFEDCREATVTSEASGVGAGVAAYAVDPAAAELLWSETKRLLTLRS